MKKTSKTELTGRSPFRRRGPHWTAIPSEEEEDEKKKNNNNNYNNNNNNNNKNNNNYNREHFCMVIYFDTCRKIFHFLI